MSHFGVNNPAKHYQQVKTQAEVHVADPHRLIEMLFEGALEKISSAKYHMAQGNVASKGENISWAMSIITGLQSSLDSEKGGEIAANLDALYGYMLQRLLKANVENDPAILDEVYGLLGEISAAWHGIATQARVEAEQGQTAASVSLGA